MFILVSIVLLIVITIVLIVYFTTKYAKSSNTLPAPSATVVAPASTVPTESLYLRLGGYEKISQMMSKITDGIINNKYIGKNSTNPKLVAWAQWQEKNLLGVKYSRAMWFSARTGGPYTYVIGDSCPYGIVRGEPLNMTFNEYSQLIEEFGKVLNSNGVPLSDRDAVLNIFTDHKDDIMSGCW